MKRACALLCCLLLALPLQGCWNYREVENLLVVAGVAVDRGQQGYKYHLTLDIADTTSAGKDKPVVSKLIETEGNTIYEAVSRVITKTGLQLYWDNCQVAVISKDVASDGILPIVDWLNRDNEPRPTIELLVSTEETAKEIISVNPTIQSITSFEIDRMYELNERNHPTSEYRTLYEIYNTLADKGRALILPTVGIAQDDKTSILNGTAVFDGDRLIGFMTAEDSMYEMYVTNHIKGGEFNVKADTGNDIASLRIFSNKTEMKPTVENGKLKVKISTVTEAALEEDDTITNYADKDQLNQFEMRAERQLAADIADSVQMIQSKFGKDILGFGDALHRSDPGAWYQLQGKWDDVFRSAQVSITCKIKIRNSMEGRSAVHKGEKP